MTPQEELREHLQKEGAYAIFVTGAGISLASGIPTFRGSDPGAVWAEDVLEMGTLKFFQHKPVKAWQWYLERFSKCRTADPNPAHIALADIEAWLMDRGCESLTVTQNIDGLHLAAGTLNLAEVHGSARKIRCSSKNCVNGAPAGFLPWSDEFFIKFLEEPTHQNLPRCPQCNRILRAHVLWFDEYYSAHEDYHIDDVYLAVDKATVVVFIGTSLSVGVTDYILSESLNNGVPVFTVDPNMEEVAPPPQVFLLGPPASWKLIREPAEVFLPSLMDSLG